MEAKKKKFDMAEYDESFLERIAELDYEDYLAYLQSLPEMERKSMEAALNRAATLQAVKALHEWLQRGL